MSEGVAAPLITRRRAMAVIIVLTIILVCLIVALVLLLRPEKVRSSAPTVGLEFERVLYGPGVGSEPFFDAPMGVAFGKNGRVYVADSGNNRIVVFDSEGRFLFAFGGLGVAKPAVGGVASWRPGLLNYPTDVAIDDDGTVYVADFHNDQVAAYSSEGQYLRVFPDRNKKVGRGASGVDGKGAAISSVAVRDGRVYATDRYQVLVFNADGALVSQFGRPGTAPGEFDHPNGIGVGPNGVLAVSDSNNNRVVGFRPGGKWLWELGEPHGIATTETVGADFDLPRGIATRPSGDFLVADAFASRLSLISSRGEVLAQYGSEGTSVGSLYFPVDVDVDGTRIAVAEKGADRVQIMRLNESE